MTEAPPTAKIAKSASPSAATSAAPSAAGLALTKLLGEPGLSIKRQLLLWLLLPQLVLWLVGGVLAYRIALNYAEKGIDQSLTQSVRSLARQVKPVGSGLLIDFPRAAQAIMEEDPSDKVSYMVSSPPGSFILGNTMLPAPPVGALPALQRDQEVIFYYAQSVPSTASARQTGAAPDVREVRVAALELNYGDASAPQRLRVQVSKSLVVRERIARELIYDMLVPLLLLGAAISFLVYAGIVRGLLPLKKLEAQLGRRESSASSTPAQAWSLSRTLSPIELRQAPQEVHSLAGAVNQLLQTVSGSIAQERRFLSNAAHQLRTPLAGLQTQTELAITMAQGSAPALQERLEKVHSGVERSAHLVNQLLSLARSEARVDMLPTDVAALAQSIAREWAPRAMAADVDLGYEGDEKLVHSANATLLREALNNLIDNALRYGKPHTGQAMLTVRVQRLQLGKATGCSIEVEDNGQGMTGAQRERAFERFYRVNDTADGCGLGLSIVQEIAQRHGGQAQLLAAVPTGNIGKISLLSA
jgi:two-component system, OmpR family, sensor histidine kinase TctE